MTSERQQQEKRSKKSKSSRTKREKSRRKSAGVEQKKEPKPEFAIRLRHWKWEESDYAWRANRCVGMKKAPASSWRRCRRMAYAVYMARASLSKPTVEQAKEEHLKKFITWKDRQFYNLLETENKRRSSLAALQQAMRKKVRMVSGKFVEETEHGDIKRSRRADDDMENGEGPFTNEEFVESAQLIRSTMGLKDAPKEDPMGVGQPWNEWAEKAALCKRCEFGEHFVVVNTAYSIEQCNPEGKHLPSAGAADRPEKDERELKWNCETDGIKLHIYDKNTGETTARKKGRRKVIGGLQNLGSTCFANALLQCLASCNSFVSWAAFAAETAAELNRSSYSYCSTIPETEFAQVNSKNGPSIGCSTTVPRLTTVIEQEVQTKRRRVVDAAFLRALSRLLCGLSANSDSVVEPNSALPVIEALLKKRWKIRTSQEQDVYELFGVFVTTWDEELDELAAATRECAAGLRSLRTNDELGSERLKSDKVPTAGVYHSYLKGEPTGDSEPILFNWLDIAGTGRQLRPPCAGLSATELKCRRCFTRTTRHNTFCSLSLRVPPAGLLSSENGALSLTLEHLLRDYFAPEVLEGAMCESCTRAGRGTLQSRLGKIKRERISKLPKCLVLRLERVGIYNGVQIKNSRHVSFPVVLDLREGVAFRSKTAEYERAADAFKLMGGASSSANRTFADASQGLNWQFNRNPWISGGSHVSGLAAGLCRDDVRFRYRYVLRSAAVHKGGPTSGHFVAYRRDENSWFCANDSRVRSASLDEVLAAEAYMLFYERSNC